MEMSKRGLSEGSKAQTSLVDSAVIEFKVDYEQITTHLCEDVLSDIFSAGGHKWRITCRSFVASSPAKRTLSIIVEHLSKSKCCKAIVEAFLMDKHGNPSVTFGNKSPSRVFDTGHEMVGWFWVVPRIDLAENYKKDGQIMIICSVMVLCDSSIPVPPSDIGKHLGQLLDSTNGTDVTFNIDGEVFHSHRAVLAARSPVFRAELLGSMAEATMPSITLHEIAPATFKAMLRFMYTDSLIGDNELEDTPSEIMHDLLAAADRYSLDRLKLMCAQKLCDCMSVDTVAVTLACAQMYNCPELKNKCMDFCAKDKNFKKAVLTKSFFQLGLQFPSIIDELRERGGL